jgi:large subunit ribosomal protein L17
MMRNIVTSLFEHERVTTTIAKAKEARPAAERLITVARRGDLAARRHVSAFVRSEEVAKKLMEDIAPRFATRPGGYTRIFRLGRRQGDAGEIGILELVERKVVKEAKPDGKKGKGKAAAKPGSAKGRKGEEEVVPAAEGGAGEAAGEKAAKPAKAKHRKEEHHGPIPKTKAAIHEKRTQATRKSGGGRQKSGREG